MNLSTEAKVGTVSLIGILLLAYMIIHLGGFTFGDKGYQIQAVFGHVNGLKEGNVVRYAGVEVGRVQSVHVTPEGVEVLLNIKPNVKLPEGSKFRIGTDGLLGEKYIDIVPPPNNSGIIQPGAVVRGEDPQGMEQMLATADKTLAEVHKLVQSLNEIFSDDKVKAAMKDSILNAKVITANLAELSMTLNRMALDNEGDVNTMVRNLAAMSSNLREVAARVDKLVANIDNNGQTAKDLRETIENLRNTSVRVEKMAASLEGVVTDPQTAANIKETLKNAREVSAKANNMLSKVNSISTEAGVEVLYNTDSDKYQSNADVKIRTSPQDFAVIGVNGIGDNSKFNFQVGQGSDQWAQRFGVVNGKPGVGVDTKLGNQLQLSVDVYDPNDVRVKLRSQYQVAPDTYLIGQTDSIKDADSTTFVGVRHSF